MPALHGIRLSLDGASAQALAPWLDPEPGLARTPAVKLEILHEGELRPPAVLELIVEEPAGWLGRTANGFVVGNRARTWFAIEDSPLRIRGVLGDTSDSTRDLLLAALLVGLRSLGLHCIHAATVSFDQHALLLIGESGAGKSTTATALVRAGCGYLGDDGVLIRQRPGDVELLPLWSSFRLTDQSLGSFETLRSHSSKLAGEEKWTLNARAAFPDRFLSHWLGRKALLFLGRSGKADSFVQPVAQAEALGLLIAQSRSFSFECDPGARRHLDLLAQLVRVAHSARLQLGTEWLVDPDGSAQRLLERAQSLFRAPDARDDVS